MTIIFTPKPMKLTDTVELMNSDDFKDRFRAEYHQLTIRISELEKMLRETKFDYALSFLNRSFPNRSFPNRSFPNRSYDLLHEQAVYMKQYQHVLEKRASIEDIDLYPND